MPDSHAVELSTQELNKVATKVCLGGKGYPEVKCCEPKVDILTNQLVYDAMSSARILSHTAYLARAQAAVGRGLQQQDGGC